MSKFLLACLAIVCTIFGLVLVGALIWLVPSFLSALFFIIPASIDIIFAGIIVLGWVGCVIWLVFRIVWIVAEPLYKKLCEKFIK